MDARRTAVWRRRAVPIAAGAMLVLAAAFVLWQTGVLGVDGGVLAGGEHDDAPSAVSRGAPPGVAGPDATSRTTGLAQGGLRPTPKTRAAEVDGPRITGRVIDTSGAGIADARVLSVPDTLTQSFAIEDVGKDDVPVSDAVTDREGRFVVAVARDTPLHAVIAQTMSGALAFELAVRTGSDVTITLHPPGSWRGTVTDLEGAPVVGARIRVLGSIDAFRFSAETQSGSKGAYRLDGIPTAPSSEAGRRWGWFTYVEVTADGFAPLMLAGSVPEPGKERERHFVLTRGSIVTGKVLDAESEAPVEGARVVLWTNDGTGWLTRSGGKPLVSPWSPRILAESKSDGAGAFRIEHAPARGFHGTQSQQWGSRGQIVAQVAVLKDGWCPGAAEVPSVLQGDTTDVVVKLWGGATIEGRVVDAAGAPATGVNVMRSSGKDRPAASLPESIFPGLAPSQPDAQGKYRLTPVAVRKSGGEEVKVVAVPKIWRGPPKEDGDGSVVVMARAGTVAVAPDLVVKPSDEASGILVAKVRVVGPDGSPVWGATVQPIGRAATASERSDAEGRTTVTFWNDPKRPVQGSLTVSAYAKDFAPVLSATVVLAEETTIKLGVARRLAGRVVTHERVAVAGASVQVGDGSLPIEQVFPERRAGASTSVVMPGVPAMRSSRGVSRPQWGQATTSDEGRFVFEQLQDGPYHLVAQLFDASSSIGRPRAVLSDVRSDAAEIEIVLPPDPTPPTGAVQGSFRDAGTGKVPIVVTVALKRGDTVAGTVSSGRDQGMTFPGPLGGRVPPSIPAPGRFEFPSVVAGLWTVWVAAEGRVIATADVNVRTGETTVVPPIELARGVVVRGRVRMPDGIAAKGRSVNFSLLDVAESKAAHASGRLASDGSFEISGLSAGRWRCVLWAHDTTVDGNVALVPADANPLSIAETESEVRFEPVVVESGAISVQATDARFPPAPWGEGGVSTDEQQRFSAGTTVTVLDASGRTIAEQKGGIQRGSSGGMNWVPVPPGRYTVRAALPGEAPKDQSVDVTRAAHVNVSIGAAWVPPTGK